MYINRSPVFTYMNRAKSRNWTRVVGEVGLGPQVQHTSAACVWAPILGVVQRNEDQVDASHSIYEALDFALGLFTARGETILDWTLGLPM
jgi:hypothetical protein